MLKTKMRIVLSALVAVLVTWIAPLGAAQITKEQLLELVGKQVDLDLIVQLVQRDCVSFDIDTASLAELSQSVPKQVLQAAIDCRASRSPSTDPLFSETPVAPLTLSQIKKLAIAPFVLDSRVDEALTAKFRESLESSKRGRFTYVDHVTLALHFEGSGQFSSAAPLTSLVAAAKAVGADALVLGTGSTYNVMGAPAVRLDVTLVEVSARQVIWSGGGQSTGGGLSLQHARGMACRSVIRKLPPS